MQMLVLEEIKKMTKFSDESFVSDIVDDHDDETNKVNSSREYSRNLGQLEQTLWKMPDSWRFRGIY